MFATNNQQHFIGDKMNIEKTKEILLGRINKLSKEEKDWISENNNGWYNRYLFDVSNNPNHEHSNSIWESMWLWSAFGQYYLRNQTLAKKFLSSEKKMNQVMDMMQDRKKWYNTRVDEIKNLYTTGKLTQEIMTFFISMFRKDNFNIFESYVKDPIFDTGAIVQFRSNIGVDAIIQEQKWSHGTNYYGANSITMHELSKKTMMVLGESPPLGGKVYASVYSHKEKQGGSRLYRVLPVGDTKVYVVVEKFLKKCRTKAVKDARK